jgi:superfamily II DNA/RNA helicase
MTPPPSFWTTLDDVAVDVDEEIDAFRAGGEAAQQEDGDEQSSNHERRILLSKVAVNPRLDISPPKVLQVPVPMNTKLFSDLGLSADVLKAIDKLGYEQASPIQAAAIPVLMQGKDVVGQSQTGSGKTAAFGIPAIEKSTGQTRRAGLVLCPTRELAVQVSEESTNSPSSSAACTSLPVYGGQSYERQLQGLRQGAHIVIGTPGRVMDHMRRGTLSWTP